MGACWATMESYYMKGHTHICESQSEHSDDAHMCSTCGRRFGVAR